MRLRFRLALMSVLPCVALLFASDRRPLVVVGDSMEPTYRSGQLLWMRRVHRELPIREGDVVVFRYDGVVSVKRVKGLPGDQVPRLRFTGGWACLLMDEISPRMAPHLVKLQARGKVTRDDVAVPSGHIFVVGDNRGVSCDSRDFGPIPLANVFGVIPAHTNRPTSLVASSR